MGVLKGVRGRTYLYVHRERPAPCGLALQPHREERLRDEPEHAHPEEEEDKVPPVRDDERRARRGHSGRKELAFGAFGSILRLNFGGSER